MNRTTGRTLIWLLTGLLLLSPLQAVSVMAQTLTEEELAQLPGYEVLIEELAAEGAALNPEASLYGGMESIAIEGQPFASGIRFSTNVEPQGTYLLQYVIPIDAAAIQKDDVMLASFYARTISSTHETAEGKVSFVMEKRETWEKSVNETMSVPSEWKRFLIPVKAALQMDANTPQVTLRLGYKPQVIEVAGLTVVNYKKTVTIDELPSTPITYEGMEEDAPWRAEANARIEGVRKGDFEIHVVDGSGQPVSGANVRVAMTEHDFKFGTAVNSSLLMGTGTNADTYREKLKENFNAVVMENEMKWAWWESDRARTANMYNWLGENGFDIRGHALLWDGPTRMPTDIGGLLGDKDALDKRIRDHFHELAGYFQGRLFDWDVLNEPVLNKMIREVHGDAYMADWFKWAKEADPTAKLFLNETQILGVNAPVIANLSNLLQTLKDHEAPIDGVGIQAHFGSTPVSPMDFYDQLTHFAGYAPEIAITEFDFNTPREDIQAMFTRDLLIATFSHPNVMSFTMWGFWDGAHWQSNAPLFRNDWSLKPSGEQWRKLIYETWRTDLSGATDADGIYANRGFYGDYDITVSHDGVNRTVKASLTRDAENIVTVNLDDDAGQSGEGFEPVAIPSQTADITSPVWPYGSTFGASGASPTSVTLQWPEAYDNRGIAGYNIYKNGSLLERVPADITRYDVTDLEQGQHYSFSVEASDEAGNVSLRSPGIEATTTSADDATLPGWTKGSFLTVADLRRTGAKLAWPAAVDNDGTESYRVYVNGTIAGDTEKLGFELTGLSENTLYTIRVEAKDWEGNLSRGGPIVTFRTLGSEDTTPPAWPGSSVLEASEIGNNGLTLSWNEAQDARGVTAYRLTMNGGEWMTLPASVRSYRVEGLTPQTSYAFAVEAGDGAGNWSASGPTISATTHADADAVAPIWPSNRKLAYSALTDRSVTLDWTEATDHVGVAGYRVYRNGELAGTLSAVERSFVATGLAPGESYVFAVQAGDGSDNWTTSGPVVQVTAFDGADRNEEIVYPSADSFIQAPAALGGAGTTNNLNYLRYKNAAGVSGSEQNKNTGNNRRAYLKFPLDTIDGDIYEATLRLYVFAVQTPNMDIPMDVYATGDNWTEDGILWNNKPEDGEKLATSTVRNGGYWKEFTVTDYVSGEAAGDGTASFKLQDDSWLDQNVDIHSKEATGANATLRPQLVVRSEQVPTDAAAPVWTNGLLEAGDATPQSVTLSWSGASDDRGINGYVVYRDGIAIAETGADMRSLVVAELAPSRSYTFAVQAKDGANESATGPAATLTTPAADEEAPLWPVDSSLQAGHIGRHDAELVWTAAEDNYGVASYVVYEGESTIAAVPGERMSYRASGLEPGTVYSFRIAARDAAGNETKGPTFAVTTLAADTSAPTWSNGSALTAADVTATGFSLSWPSAGDDVGVSRYKVYLDGRLVAELPASVGSYYLNGLSDGSAYLAAVEAVDAAGNASSPLSLDAVRTLKRDSITPQWPTGSRISAVHEADHTVLQWDEAIDNEGVASYTIYRNGAKLATVDGLTFAYTVAGAPDSNAVFKVEAADLAGNSTVFGPATNDPVIPVPEDTTAPGWPAGSVLQASAVKATSAKLSWSEAVDRMSGVTYRVYADGALIATTERSEWLVEGLTPRTAYAFKVEAGDEAGNWTTSGPSLSVTTSSLAVDYPTGFPPAGNKTPSIEVKNDRVNVVLSDTHTTVSGGKAVAAVDEQVLAEAFGQAVTNAAGERRITLQLPALSGVTGYVIDIPATYLNGNDATRIIEVDTPLGRFALPGHMLANNAEARGAAIISASFSMANPGLADAAPGESRVALDLQVTADGRELAYNHPGAFADIRIPYSATADERRHAEGLNVWRIGEDGIAKLVPSGRYDAAAREMAFKTDQFSVYVVSYFMRSFADLEKTPWAVQAVEALASKGIVNGVSERAFNPGAIVTRADFAKLIVATLGLQAESFRTFADVGADDYYYEAVGIAAALGIVQGKGDGLFHPKEAITRQDMFVMIARALKQAGAMLPGAAAAAEYADRSSIAEYALEVAASLAKEGLIQGSGDGNLHPERRSTRAEAAVLLYRVFYYMYR